MDRRRVFEAMTLVRLAVAKALVAAVAATLLIAQTPVGARRVAGLPPEAWPIGDGGPASDALLAPAQIAFDPLRTGGLLITDSRTGRLRRIDASGTISTVAQWGTGHPAALAVDSRGNAYVGLVVPTRLIRISPNGRMDGIAIPGSTSPPGEPPPLPLVAVDAADNLYLVETLQDFTAVIWTRGPDETPFRKVNVEGARLANVGPIAADRRGNLYLGDLAGVLKLQPRRSGHARGPFVAAKPHRSGQRRKPLPHRRQPGDLPLDSVGGPRGTVRRHACHFGLWI